MLKLYRKVLAAGAVALGLAACGDDVTVTNPPPPPAPGVTSVTIAPANITISINQEVVFAASVIADAGVATTVTWNTNNPAIASVDASGKVKGLTVGTTTITATSTADNSKVGVATVTVAGNPPGIVSFTVTPLVMTLAPAQFQQASAQIVTAFGVATPAVTWGTSNPAVATVSATGLVTGVAAGAAVVTASITVGTQTSSATIGVTVRALVAATVSIKSITTGLTTLPVNVGNVFGQIEVTLNFNGNEQSVDSVNVFLGAKRAAKQSFVTNPAAGDLVFSINTANFTKNLTAGTATVDYLNGSTTVSAAMYPRGASTGTATEVTPIVLNNVDGWAADITKPSLLANSAAGITFWGGPTANTSATLYPVVYTPGRSISTVTWTLGPGGVAGCATVTQTTLPFTRTWGYTAASTPVGTAASLCTAYENLGGVTVRDNVVVTAALDNASNVYPLVNAATPLIPNAVVLAACVPVTAGCVAGATPDSLRIDYKAPVVTAPSIVQVAPRVTGWLNASYNFLSAANWGGSVDLGVGIRATSDRAVQWNSTNCPGVVAVNLAMATGTGADINGGVACPTNFIGGTLGLGSPGTAPWRVRGTESDRLNNLGLSGLTPTFGTDYTAPSIRWGLADASVPYLAAVNQAGTPDTIFTLSKPTTQTFRAEFLDERSGFLAASAEVHQLSRANHANPLGSCIIGTAPIGATFVTNPGCTMVTVASGSVRLDGWLGGANVAVPTAEAYYGYRAQVTDEAGNTSLPVFRRLLVNTNAPLAASLGIAAVLTGSNFNFLATFSDSAEVINQSMQLTFPNIPGASDSLRYTQAPIGLAFDDVITSPFFGNIGPPTGAPFARGVEVVTGAAFPASNVGAYTPATVKPIKAQAWSWNPSNFSSVSTEIGIPALNVETGTGIAAYNIANPVNAVVHWRIITTVATTNQFGSVTPLRAQVVSPTGSQNAPFTRVDFYRLDAGGTWYNYLGSVAGVSAIGTDQGTYRSWVYALENASFVKTWNGTAAGAVAAGNVIIAVGVVNGLVVSNGDAISTVATTMIP